MTIPELVFMPFVVIVIGLGLTGAGLAVYDAEYDLLDEDYGPRGNITSITLWAAGFACMITGTLWLMVRLDIL